MGTLFSEDHGHRKGKPDPLPAPNPRPLSPTTFTKGEGVWLNRGRFLGPDKEKDGQCFSLGLWDSGCSRISTQWRNEAGRRGWCAFLPRGPRDGSSGDAFGPELLTELRLYSKLFLAAKAKAATRRGNEHGRWSAVGPGRLSGLAKPSPRRLSRWVPSYCDSKAVGWIPLPPAL